MDSNFEIDNWDIEIVAVNNTDLVEFKAQNKITKKAPQINSIQNNYKFNYQYYM